MFTIIEDLENLLPKELSVLI